MKRFALVIVFACGVAALQRGVLLHLAHDATSRTNVGFVNANDTVRT
ncbi:MAG TPA: hypothetical protein VGQ76_00640 [Thermoanaerobaculia bacterium]|nr:hypothetical protein [Thermoanaerobaculia bacterium]